MDGRLFTTRELAEYLGLSCETVLRRRRRGDIPGGIRLASNVLRFGWLAERRTPRLLPRFTGPSSTRSPMGCVG